MSEKGKQVALSWIEENEKRIIEVSDAIWGFAELGLREFKSSKLLADELERHGFRVERGVAGMPTAFVATWGEGRPVIGVMGEYDALPGLSQKPVPYKEPLKEGAPGHGCGHNIHGTSGMAGAIAVRYAMEEAGIQGTIKFYGTPAEESASGKVWMVRAGVFDGVDAVLSHHPSSMNVAGLSSSLANNSVKFHFYGKSSHAAGSPEQGRSALDAVELMNVGVNYLREHVVQEARIHYVIEAGGGQPNVVPDYARSWYLIRAPERDQVEEIYKRILDIAKGAALMTGTTYKVEFLKAIYNKIPSRTLSELVTANMREIGSPEYTEEELEFAEELAKTISEEAKREALRKSKRPGWEDLMDVLIDRTIPDAWNEGEVGRGSTDVADVSWQAPTMEFGTATYVLGTPGHSWHVVAQSGMGLGHKSLIFASKVIAASALDLLTKPELLKRAWEELKERTKGRAYRTPLPPDAQPPLDMWSQ
ncbi:amidohydrolase [Candidatus Bathyarchaeota archaeon]|nr:MAG: amidohydrolase [Candidatus Bathyarchaeota archaeon]